MVIQIREKDVNELQKKLKDMKTDLNKIAYLESALKQNFTFEIKRFIWGCLSELYEKKAMYEKAGKAMSNKAGAEVSFRDKIESYLRAGEFFAKAGKIEDSEEMFIRALRNANFEQKSMISLARKNIYFISAEDLEKKAKNASACKFYEKLIQMNLDDIEKKQVKEKLLKTYKALGKFREAKLLEGIK
jgi:tetratricopeptide (TPR) repeat protein